MVAEVREADASPEVRDIYTAIRTATGVPLVNLIWRHLATMPGVLPWAWEAVSGALSSGAVAAASGRVLASLSVPELPALPLGEGEQGAAAVIEVYNRGNVTNLLTLTALLRRLDAPADEVPILGLSDVFPAATLAPVPPLPRLAELELGAAERVRRLAAQHPDLAPGVIPSLYLHLALWPDLLSRLEPVLALPLGDGRMAAARSQAIRAADDEATVLLPYIVPRTPLATEHAPAVRSALGAFTRQVIPEMVPVGLALSAAMRSE